MDKPLRICMLMQGGQEWMGGVQYIKNIVLALGELPEEERREFEIHLVVNKSLNAGHYAELQPVIAKLHTLDDFSAFGNSLALRILRRVSARDWRTIFFLRKMQFDFVFPHTGSRGLLEPYRSAAWIPDFQHKRLPEYCDERERSARDSGFGDIARRAQDIVLSSADAERDFKRFYPEQSHKAYVMRFRTVPDKNWYSGDPVETKRKYNLPERFFLICNQFWRHKNHFAVIEALRRLRAADVRVELVSTGHLHDYRHPGYSDELLSLIATSGVSDQVRILGMIPRYDQMQLVRRSLALIQPSFFEGWNTSVEEARCLGKIVLLSDLPVHREQNPAGAEFFDPGKPEELARLMKRCWESLSPGPDPAHEAEARSKAQILSREFAHRFLQLASGERRPITSPIEMP